jgi:hypothetical protein
MSSIPQLYDVCHNQYDVCLKKVNSDVESKTDKQIITDLAECAGQRITCNGLAAKVLFEFEQNTSNSIRKDCGLNTSIDNFLCLNMCNKLNMGQNNDCTAMCTNLTSEALCDPSTSSNQAQKN